MKVAFLFPGQGSQQLNMLHQLPKHPIIAATIEEASAILGENVLLLDTEMALLSTRAVQLALLIAGVAAGRALKAEGALPDIVAGHSVGSFAAAVIARALEFADALVLVQLRGQLMEKAYPKGYGMGVITGLDERRVALLTEQVRALIIPIYVANINAPDQITIAGSHEGIQAVFTLARSAGAQKIQFLNVSVPSHCNLLQEVADTLVSKMATIHVQYPSIPYIGNCRARSLKRVEDIRTDLGIGVANPVRWHDVTTLMFELGVRFFVEVGTGQTLTNMARKAFPTARSMSMEDSGLESITILTNREKEK